MLLLLAGVFGLAACGGDDAASPDESFAGTYVLNGVENGTLPILVSPIAFGGSVELSGATLVLEREGVARDVRRFRELEPGGGVARTFSDSSETTWRVAGGRLLIDRPFPPSNPLPERLRVDTGTVNDGPLFLRVRFTFNNTQTLRLDTTLVYVRATAP